MKTFSIFSVVLFLSLAASLIISGCVSSQPPSRANALTYGMVSDNLIKGQTTKNQVLGLFGPPNITTKNGEGNDVWTYDKVGTEASASSVYGTAILFGGNRNKASSSASTVTLSVTFDAYGYVKDYDFYQTRY